MANSSTTTKVGPWQGVVVGVDLGDQNAKVEVEGPDGTLLEVTSVAMTTAALARYFSRLRGARVIIEAGTHSPWVSRVVDAQGCQSVVVNPRRVRLIAESTGKSDNSDPGVLRFLGRVGLGTLNPVYHRSEQAQRDMALLNARALLVRQRTALIAHVRFVAKSMGRRRETWESVMVKGRKHYLMPAELVPALKPLMEEADVLTWRINEYKKAIEKVIRERYPEAQQLRQIRGVGPITALTFVLMIHDKDRFRRSRVVGAYFGMVPKRRQSGKKDPELAITKAGNKEMRRLLVQCAQYILSHKDADSDLRRWGLKKTEGGKRSYRRGVVALARKLAVVMHRLWVTGADYEPFRKREEVATAA